jgi:serine/threonine protein kinase
MVMVFLSHDLQHRRRVALKVVPPGRHGVIHREVKPENVLLKEMPHAGRRPRLRDRASVGTLSVPQDSPYA